MVFQKKNNRLLQVLTISSVLALAGCGDSSDDSDSSSSTTISGSIFASHVKGASVSVYDENDQVIAGPVTTNNMGRYSISIANADVNNRLRFVSSGGTYTDEATGDTLVEASELAVYVAAGEWSVGDEVHATPMSTIRHGLIVDHGLSPSEAASVFENAFGFTTDFTIAPTDATAPAVDASDEEKLAGLRAAMFSQLTSDMAMPAGGQAALLIALAADLSDGELDGMDANGVVIVSGSSSVSLQAQIQSQMNLALNNFRQGNDASGLGPHQVGILPFAKLADSASYRFEYLEGMMSAMEGKTKFQLRVTDVATGSIEQSGLSLSLMAKMHMETKMHTTPVDGCLESATSGTYDCTLFYLMPSVMNDMSMGYWELNVTADNMETVQFYPSVTMAMNGAGKHKLTAQATGTTIVDDLTISTYDDYVMMMTSARKYFMFKDDVSGSAGNHTVRLFVAVQESMMSFPALYQNQTYNVGELYSLMANLILMELSTDGSTWSAMTDEGDGYWNIASVTGLTDGQENNFYLRLTVNGEQKTTNGMLPAGDGTNDYSTFTFTLN